MFKKGEFLAYGCLFLTAVIWGISTPVIKYILNFLNPWQFIFWRLLTASVIIIVPLIIVWHHLKISLKDILKYLLIGFLGTPLTLIIFSFGLQKTSAVNTSIISTLSPILIILGGVYFFREKVSARKKWGILLIISGTLVALVGPMIKNGVIDKGSFLGDIAVIFAYLCWVAYSLLIKKEKKLNFFCLTASSFVVGLLVSFGILLFSPKNVFSFEKITGNPLLTGSLVFVGIFSTVVAYFTYAIGISKIEASKAVIFTYLQPIFGIPVAILLLKEKVDPIFWLGAGLIVIGVCICQFLGQKHLPVEFKPKTVI